jgi:hypothetical protein
MLLSWRALRQLLHHPPFEEFDGLSVEQDARPDHLVVLVHREPPEPGVLQKLRRGLIRGCRCGRGHREPS